jgi:DnaJ-class molecular chaperone with C-terminal Zn finger domain
VQERDKVGNRRYEEIEKAAKVLGLHDTATMNEIKENYRKLMIRWHPDICRENQKNVRRWCERSPMRIELLSIIAIIMSIHLGEKI